MANNNGVSRRTAAAASSGNLLEWYDFTVYGFLAPIIGKAFFPSDDPVASTLSAFAVLAAGYLARPVGSVIFGHIGDRIGRKTALIASVLIMGAGSLAISILPDYASIGIAAPILLVVIRVTQGIAVAGEYTASGVLMVESAPTARRHRIGSIIAFAMMLGCMAGSGVPAAIGQVLSDTQFTQWGWRIPFALGAVVALTSFFLRMGLVETVTADGKRWPEPPLLTAVRNHWRAMITMILLMAPVSILYFMIFVYASSYLTQEMNVAASTALEFSTINLLVTALAIPPLGWAADRFGARAIWFAAAVLGLVAAFPLWAMMHSSHLTLVFLGQMGFGLLNAAGWALSVSTLPGLVPTAVRCTAVCVGYNIGVAAFGGTTPILATYLVTRTGDDFAPAIYFIVATLISLIAIWKLPRRLPAYDDA